MKPVKTRRGCPLFEAEDQEKANNCLNCKSWSRQSHHGRCSREADVLTARVADECPIGDLDIATSLYVEKQHMMEEIAELKGTVGTLRTALEDLLKFAELYGDFRNGTTDPSGAHDEGDYIASRVFQSTREVLQQTQ